MTEAMRWFPKRSGRFTSVVTTTTARMIPEAAARRLVELMKVLSVEVRAVVLSNPIRCALIDSASDRVESGVFLPSERRAISSDVGSTPFHVFYTRLMKQSSIICPWFHRHRQLRCEG